MQRNLHPVGLHEATIADHGYRKSKAGNDMLVVTFETEHGDLWGWFACTDEAIQHTIRKIQAMGFDGDDLGDLADGTALRGYRCKIEVKHETYEGEVRAKVDWVHPIDYEPGLIRNEEAAANVRRFNALFKKARADKPVRKSEPATTPSGKAEFDDDDIPF